MSNAECPEFDSPLCGLNSVRNKLESYGAFVFQGTYHSVGAFGNALEQDEIIVGLKPDERTASVWDSVNLGCIACGKCLIVTNQLDEHVVERRADIGFQR